MAVIDGHDGRGEWLTVRQAALRLGLSERTLYRRVHDHTLRTRETVAGREVWVPLAEASGDARPVTGVDDEERALILVERFAMLAERQAGPLLERLETLARENGQLQARIAELEQRLSALDTGQATPDAAQDAPGSPVAPLLTAQTDELTSEPSEPPRRPDPAPAPIPPDEDGQQPWWRRWWLAIAGAGLLALVTASSCQAVGPSKHAELYKVTGLTISFTARDAC